MFAQLPAVIAPEDDHRVLAQAQTVHLGHEPTELGVHVGHAGAISVNELAGELIRDGTDQTLTVDPNNLSFIFQGMLDGNKSGKDYGQFQWRIGMLTPVAMDE